MDIINEMTSQLLVPQNLATHVLFNPSDFKFWITHKNIYMVRRLKKRKVVK